MELLLIQILDGFKVETLFFFDTRGVFLLHLSDTLTPSLMVFSRISLYILLNLKVLEIDWYYFSLQWS